MSYSSLSHLTRPRFHTTPTKGSALLIIRVIKVDAGPALILLRPAGSITLLTRVLGLVDSLSVLVQRLVRSSRDLGSLEQLSAWVVSFPQHTYSLYGCLRSKPASFFYPICPICPIWPLAAQSHTHHSACPFASYTPPSPCYS